MPGNPGRPVKDLTGLAFGRLMVLRRSSRVEEEAGRPRRRYWICRCDCGQVVEVKGSHLVAMETISCGCFSREQSSIRLSARLTRHGHATRRRQTGEFGSWQGAKGRCFNPSHPKYPEYGGRGITMCPEWAADFVVFFRDMGPRPDGTSLDRIESDGNYEPGNCRWATPTVQQNNRRINHRVTLEGHLCTLTQAARTLGLGVDKLSRMLRNGRVVHDGQVVAEAMR